MNLETGSRLQTLTIQETGGTEKTVSRGVEIIKEMLSEANLAEREPVPASHLIVGLECGDSDAYSGITVSIALPQCLSNSFQLRLAQSVSLTV